MLGIAVEAGLIGSAGTAFTVLAWLAIPTGAMVAGYTAFLFGQAEGRDLWQSPLLFWHLLAQAVMVGAGALAVAAAIAGTAAAGVVLIGAALTIATVVHLLMLLLEYGGRHATAGAAAAAHMITHGRYARAFWARRGRPGRRSPQCWLPSAGPAPRCCSWRWPGWPCRLPC